MPWPGRVVDPGPWTPRLPVGCDGRMAAFALDHIVLVVSDVERTLAWYGRHAGLGAERVEEWRRGELPFPSLRVDEGAIIDIVPGVDDPGRRGALDPLCF